jgi:hypothetical protein
MNKFARTNSKAPEPFTTLRSGAVFTEEQEMFLHAEAPSFYMISPERRHDHTNFFRGALVAAAISSPFWIVAIICAIRYFNNR